MDLHLGHFDLQPRLNHQEFLLFHWHYMLVMIIEEELG